MTNIAGKSVTDALFFPGDLIVFNKVIKSCETPNRRCRWGTREPKRYAQVGEVKLIIGVVPVNCGLDQITTNVLTTISEHGIEFFRVHRKNYTINFTVLRSTGLSEQSPSST